MVADKVNFGADRQAGMVGYLRDCAAASLPGIASGGAADVSAALAGDKAVDARKSGCLEVGARHIESTQQHYGDSK